MNAADLSGSKILQDADYQSAFHLTKDQIHQFYQDGFLKVPRVASATEVKQIRTLLKSLFERFNKLPTHLAHDLDECQYADGMPRNPEIGRCLKLERELAQTHYIRNAKAIARQLLGPEARICYDHAIFKPPHSNSATKWHQDEAYDKPVGAPELRASLWLALQDVTVENGCLQFIPNSHKVGLLPHYHPTATAHALTTDCVDPTQAVACPLSAGDITIHHGRTLHYAGPNITDRPRLAWILDFAVGGKTVRARLIRYLVAPTGQHILGWPTKPDLN
jgi:hypothetical protein